MTRGTVRRLRDARAAVAALMATAAAAATLAGCVSGPDYRRPTMMPGATGPFRSGGGVSQADSPPAAWWRLYDDPVADRLVSEALAANTDLRVALANIAQAQALYDEARATRYPATTLTAGASYGRSQSADSIAAALGGRARDQFTYSGGASAAYEIDLFGRVRRTLQAAGDDVEASAAAGDAVRVAVASDTLRAYADACAAGDEARVATESANLAQAAYDLALRQRSAGVASDFDVERSGALLASARAAAPPLEGARRSAAFQLAFMLGRTPAQAPPEAFVCRHAPVMSGALPVGDGAGLLARRPDVRAAERRLAASTARIGVAVAGLYPTVSFAGSLQEVANRSLRGPAALSYGLGPLVSWSFPNQVAARARIRQAKGAAAADLARFDAAVLQALEEVEQALSVYAAERTRLQALTQSEARSASAFRMAQAQFDAGAASRVEVIVAEQAAIAAAAQRAAAATRLVDDQIAVFKALGGGWEVGPYASMVSTRRNRASPFIMRR